MRNGNVVPIDSIYSPFLYTGRSFDLHSRLFDNRHRFYDPSLGRFISEDPLGVLGGTNLFLYSEARPTTRMDLFGLSPTGEDADHINRPTIPRQMWYGNYCGEDNNWKLGPINGLDVACLEHDSCYASLDIDLTSAEKLAIGLRGGNPFTRVPKTDGVRYCEVPRNRADCDSNFCLSASQYAPSPSDYRGQSSRKKIMKAFCPSK